MLNTASPEASVSTAVCPDHFALALAFIVVILANISVTTFPLEDTLSVLLIVEILSFVGITAMVSCLFLPLAMTVLETPYKLSCVITSISPFVLAESLRFSVHILSNENVPI